MLGTVVLAYGDPVRAGECCRSLVTDGAVAERLLVVQNPANSTEPTLPAPMPGASVLRLKRNLGYGYGMNVGLATLFARGCTHVALVTHDARPRPGCLDALAAACRDDRFGLVAPELMESGKDQIWSLGGSSVPGHTFHLTRLDQPNGTDGLVSCDWVDGAFMVVSRSGYEAAGPIEESFFLYYEDTEYGWRMRRQGFEVGVCPGAVAEQRPGGGGRQGAFMYLMTRNGLEYQLRAHGWGGMLIRLLAQLKELEAFARAVMSPNASMSRRAGGAASIVGVFAGLFAFALRRFGPPPRWMPVLGDIGHHF